MLRECLVCQGREWWSCPACTWEDVVINKFKLKLFGQSQAKHLGAIWWTLSCRPNFIETGLNGSCGFFKLAISRKVARATWALLALAKMRQPRNSHPSLSLGVLRRGYSLWGGGGERTHLGSVRVLCGERQWVQMDYYVRLRVEAVFWSLLNYIGWLYLCLCLFLVLFQSYALVPESFSKHCHAFRNIKYLWRLEEPQRWFLEEQSQCDAPDNLFLCLCLMFSSQRARVLYSYWLV